MQIQDILSFFNWLYNLISQAAQWITNQITTFTNFPLVVNRVILAIVFAFILIFGFKILKKGLHIILGLLFFLIAIAFILGLTSPLW